MKDLTPDARRRLKQLYMEHQTEIETDRACKAVWRHKDLFMASIALPKHKA